MPYMLALAVWQISTFALYLSVIGVIVRRIRGVVIGPIWLPIAAGFPAVFINLGHGQNGLLTAGLFCAAPPPLPPRPPGLGRFFFGLAPKPPPAPGVPLPLLPARPGRPPRSPGFTARSGLRPRDPRFGDRIHCQRRLCRWLPRLRDQPAGRGLDRAPAVARHRRRHRHTAWSAGAAGILRSHIAACRA